MLGTAKIEVVFFFFFFFLSTFGHFGGQGGKEVGGKRQVQGSASGLVGSLEGCWGEPRSLTAAANNLEVEKKNEK